MDGCENIEKKIDKEDCTCPICMYIMVEPVTMPCKHSLCMYCFTQTVAVSNLVCPICRLRINVWVRRATKAGNLVDRQKWQTIQEAFPKKVQKRMEAMKNSDGDDSLVALVDEDDDSDDDLDSQTRLRKQKELSKPGEIREEYAAAMEKIRQQREAEARKEEEASAALIKALQEEEAKETQRLKEERENLEKLNLAAAEQLKDMSPDDLQRKVRPSSNTKNQASQLSKSASKRKGRNSSASKSSRAKSALEGRMYSLNNFFSPVPRTPSAPPVGLRIAQLSDKQKAKVLSPYPYACISPKDKILYAESVVTARARSNSCSSDEAPGLAEVEDHPYSTRSARPVDLTNPNIAAEMGKERTDVPTYDLSKVKSEPEDIFAPGPSGMNKFDQQSSSTCLNTSPHSIPSQSCTSIFLKYSPFSTCKTFKPIQSHPKTPPKKSYMGAENAYPPIILPSCDFNRNSVKNLTSTLKQQTAGNICGVKKSVSGVGKNSAAAALKKSQANHRNAQQTAFQNVGRDRMTTSDASNRECIVIDEEIEICPSNSDIVMTSSTSGELVPYVENLKINCDNDSDNKIKETDSYVPNVDSEQKDCENVPESKTVTHNIKNRKKPLSLARGNNSNSTHVNKPKASSLKSASSFFHESEQTNNNENALSTKVCKTTLTKSLEGATKEGKANNVSTLNTFIVRKKRNFSELSISDDDDTMTQEEKDHLVALRLQKHFEMLEKKGTHVDRMTGSGNEYSLRRKRRCKTKF